MKASFKMILNMEKESKLSSKDVNIPNLARIHMLKKIDMLEVSNTDTSRDKVHNIHNMDNMMGNGTKV